MLAPQLAIALAAVLFGTTFLVVKDAVAEVGPVPFLAVRFLVGGIVLLPFARVRAGRRRAPSEPGLIRAGTLCGLALVTGYILQTVGLQYISASVSAFVTYLLVVLVPVIAAVTLRRPPEALTMVGVVVAAAGLFLLTGGRPGLGWGEVLTLGCALAFAVHIVLLADLAPRFSSARLNAVQLLVGGGMCLVPGFFLGGYRFSAGVWAAALYTGVAVSALALALQVWGQQRVGPTHTSLLLMIEPVSAAVLGATEGERLAGQAWLGALLILVGILVSELRPFRRHVIPTD